MWRACSTSFRRALAFRSVRQSSSYDVPPFWIVDSTLREGEQFATADFTTLDRVYIAKNLDRLGVDYIELANPAASRTAHEDLKTIVNSNLKAKVLTHTRCNMHDVKLAVDSGVHGVNVYMATSPILAQHSHGKAIDEILRIAEEVIAYVKDSGKEIRFSCEDTFRSNKEDVLTIYSKVSQLGVHRVGIADTVGIATARQVREVVGMVRQAIDSNVGIEFHVHNDTGGCITNALEALEAGATHIDTCVLGIGERNGITPLGGFLARMYSLDKEMLMKRYNLEILSHLEKYVSKIVGAPVPFNNYVTGSCAFTHKAGVHTKAILNNPAAYEVISPEDFGVTRRVQVAHRLTGWNVISARAKELNLSISDEKIKVMTATMKNLADQRQFSTDELDAILIKLASSERPDNFITIGKDGSSKEKDSAEDITAMVNEAVESSCTDDEDFRPYRVLQFTGHLFDHKVVNRVFDVATEHDCAFKVLRFSPATENELLSSITLEIKDADETKLQMIKERMEQVAMAAGSDAECSMVELARSSTAKPTTVTKRLKVTGDLFDKAIFNNVLDIIVISSISFNVVNIHVGQQDDLQSHCIIDLSHDRIEDLNRVILMVQKVVDSSRNGRECMLEELPI